LIRDDAVHCDHPGCHRIVKQEAMVIKAKYGIRPNYCLSHLKDHTARLVLEAKEQSKNRVIAAGKQEAKAPSVSPPLSIDQLQYLTTVPRIAEFFRVKPSIIKKYLVETGVFSATTFEGESTIYVPKEEVLRIAFLGTWNPLIFQFIPQIARFTMFGFPKLPRRFDKGVLD
jgi:hypothetical protein